MTPISTAAARHATPMVSIVTATFNAEATIRACLESVAAQDYPRVQHVVIDGASTDSTMEIVRKYPPVRWLSEPDAGIYDAWNKALELAQGEWIAFLGADDVYLPGAVSAYMQLAREKPDARYLSSYVRWIGPRGKARRIGRAWSWPQFQRYMCTAHVGSMHHRSLYRMYGKYDASLRIVADYEFLLRAGAELRTAFLPEVTAVMQGGGASDSLASIEETARVKITTGKRKTFLSDMEARIARQIFRARRLTAGWL